MAVCYRRFGKTYRRDIQSSSLLFGILLWLFDPWRWWLDRLFGNVGDKPPNLYCVNSQKSASLICTVVEAWNIRLHLCHRNLHRLQGMRVLWTLFSWKSLQWKPRYRPNSTLLFMFSAINYWPITTKTYTACQFPGYCFKQTRPIQAPNIPSTKSNVTFSLLRSYQNISPGPRQVFKIRNKASFYGEELSTPRPTPKLEDHPLSAVRASLFNLFTSTLHIADRTSIRNMRARHAVVTGTHFSRVTRKTLQPQTALKCCQNRFSLGNFKVSSQLCV